MTNRTWLDPTNLKIQDNLVFMPAGAIGGAAGYWAYETFNADAIATSAQLDSQILPHTQTIEHQKQDLTTARHDEATLVSYGFTPPASLQERISLTTAHIGTEQQQVAALQAEYPQLTGNPLEFAVGSVALCLAAAYVGMCGLRHALKRRAGALPRRRPLKNPWIV